MISGNAHEYIFEFGLMVLICSLVAQLLKIVKVPSSVGFIISGFLLGPQISFVPTVQNNEIVQMWAELGIIFVFFNLGLELNLKKIFRIGPKSLILALIEVSACFYVGFLFGQLIGFDNIQSVYLGAMLGISSTTIVAKGIEEFDLKGKSFAQKAIGILLFEDILAMAIMIILTAYNATKAFSGEALITALFKMTLFVVLSVVIGTFIVPTLLKRFKNEISSDILVLFGSGAAVLMSLLASYLGFSSALGAFIMGTIISGANVLHETQKMIDPLKKIFTAIFFVSIGMLLKIPSDLHGLLLVAGLTLTIVVSKFFFVFFASSIVGEKFEDATRGALTLTQIGEFAFIIGAMGYKENILSSDMVSNVIFAAILSNLVSPFLIRNSGQIHLYLKQKLPEKFLDFLEKYSNSTMFVNSTQEQKRELVEYVTRMVVTHSLILGVTILTSRKVPKLIYPLFKDQDITNYLTLGITIFICLPFYWALASGKIKHNVMMFKKTKTILIHYLMQAGRILGVGLLLSMQLSLFVRDQWLPICVIFIAVGIIWYRLSKKIESFYLWLEQGFVKNLQEDEEEETPFKNAKAFLDSKLVDNKLSYCKVHPNSFLVGKSLRLLKIRQRFSVNIVMLQRGQKVLIPRGKTKFLPFDEIGVIGEKNNLKAWEHYFEICNTKNESDQVGLHISNFELFTALVSDESVLANKTIRQLFTEKKLKIRLVGVQRESGELIFPLPDFELKIGDVCWFVGEKSDLNTLLYPKVDLDSKEEVVQVAS